MINGQIPEWPKGTDCKSAGTAFGGSNPPSPTKMQVDKLSSGIYTKYISAGWSSLEARRAHNPKVAGSNPAPAIFCENFKYAYRCTCPDSSVGRAED